MAGEILGRKILIKIAGAAVASVRTKSITINNEPVDVTNDDDLGVQRMLDEPGQKNIEISVEGLYSGDTLRALADQSLVVENVELIYSSFILSGSFFIGSYNEGMPYNDAITFSGTLSSSGSVSKGACSSYTFEALANVFTISGVSEITVRLNADVYACVFGGDIYKQTGGAGSFLPLSQAVANWNGMTSLGADVYACVSLGDIYKQTAGAGDFIALGAAPRAWSGMTTLGSDVYACVFGVDIFKQTGGVGSFVALNQTFRDWNGMTTLGSDVYACVYNGDIYKQTGGVGDFLPLSQVSRLWTGMTVIGADVYASVQNGDIYRQTSGAGDFVAIGQASREWSGIAGYVDQLNNRLYASTSNDGLYVSTATCTG